MPPGVGVALGLTDGVAVWEALKVSAGLELWDRLRDAEAVGVRRALRVSVLEGVADADLECTDERDGVAEALAVPLVDGVGPREGDLLRESVARSDWVAVWVEL